MRIIISVSVLCAFSSFASLGQEATQSIAPTVTRLTPTVVERGPHHRVWETTTLTTDPQGTITTNTGSYTELGTGLHFWEEGVWKDSVAAFDLSPDGAIARRGQHQVTLRPNPNAIGAVDLLMSGGKQIQSHVIGLSYYDASSGNSVLIAELKDSIGELHPPNVVVYPNAFTDIKADLRYTYTIAGLEQDVILRERPPAPNLFGLDPRTTRLEVVTEFDTAPQPKADAIFIKGETDPQVRLLMNEPDFIDHALDFGPMQIGLGQAFMLDAEPGLDPRENIIPVAKKWNVIEGRNILFFFLKQWNFLRSNQPWLSCRPAKKEFIGLGSHLTIQQLTVNGSEIGWAWAKPLRIEKVGGWYHVTARGNERKTIFRDDLDRRHFREVLAEMVLRFHVRLHCFVLMGNHYHLLLEGGGNRSSIASTWRRRCGRDWRKARGKPCRNRWYWAGRSFWRS